jgi:hypothetical protein
MDYDLVEVLFVALIFLLLWAGYLLWTDKDTWP